MRFLLLVPFLGAFVASEVNWRTAPAVPGPIRPHESAAGVVSEYELITVFPLRELEIPPAMSIVGASFNGGSFTGGFCGSLGALGGDALSAGGTGSVFNGGPDGRPHP